MEIAPGVHAVRLLNVYAFLIDEPQLSLIDAGLIGSAGRVQRYVKGIGRTLDDLGRIICTHAHPDHIGGVRELAGERDVDVLMHPADLEGLKVKLRDAVANRNRGQLIAYFTRHPGEATPVTDGQVLPILGGLQVVHTPGHTPGSICLLAGNQLITGDTLFPGGPGRTNRPEDLQEEIRSITSRLFVLPDETHVHPGHGDGTTLGVSKKEYVVFASREHPPDLCGDVTWEG